MNKNVLPTDKLKITENTQVGSYPTNRTPKSKLEVYKNYEIEGIHSEHLMEFQYKEKNGEILLKSKEVSKDDKNG